MTENKPSIADIRAAHSSRSAYERYLFANTWFFRPLSYPLTWAAVRAGLSSEAVSWLSGLAALGGLACLALPDARLGAGVALLFLFNLLDCADGDVSRVMRTRNPYGRFLDSAMWWADMLFWTVVGWAVMRAPGLRQSGDALGLPPGAWLAAGIALSFLVSYSVYIEGVFDQVLRPHWEALRRRDGVEPAATPVAGKPLPEAALRVLVHNLRVRETHYTLAAVCFAAGCADVMLVFFLLFNLLFCAALMFSYCRRGRRIRAAGLGREGA